MGCRGRVCQRRRIRFQGVKGGGIGVDCGKGEEIRVGSVGAGRLKWNWVALERDLTIGVGVLSAEDEICVQRERGWRVRIREGGKGLIVLRNWGRSGTRPYRRIGVRIGNGSSGRLGCKKNAAGDE